MSAVCKLDQEMTSKYLLTLLFRPSDGLDQPVVAAGNIELITDSSVIREEMFPVAGRFFKRFDKDACQFVSNMDDEYPFL